MDTLFGVIIIAVAGYFVMKWVLKDEVVKEEIKEVATKVEAEVKKEAEVVVSKAETAVVEEVKIDTVKLEEKTKVIEAVIEANAEKLEAAVKKTKAKKNNG
jgi:hypothetical protein